MAESNKNLFGMSNRNQYILISVLVVVFVGLLAQRLTAGSDSDGIPDAQPQQVQAPFSIDQLIAVPRLQPPRLNTPPESLPRNLFALPPHMKAVLEARLVVEEKAEENAPDPEIQARGRALRLKGIIGSERERIAYIEQRAVRQGDSINGFTVVEIGERNVLVKQGSTEVLLELARPGF